MKFCKSAILLFAAAGFLFTTGPADAGLVMTYKDRSTVYYQDGKVAHKDKTPHWSAVDARKGIITFINDSAKTYSSGTPEEMCKSFEKSMEQMMAQVPPEYRAMMFGDGKPPRVTIKNLGSGGKVAGYPTQKYEVTKNGKSYSVSYISTDKRLLNATGMKWSDMSKLGGAFDGCMSMDPTDPEKTEVYQKLMSKGIVLKEKMSISEATEVTKIEIKKVAGSVFAVPKGYKKKSFDEMMSQMMENGGSANRQ